MAKAQVLVTVTAEALIEVPVDVADVEAYCREHVALHWGELRIEQVVQSPSVTVEHFLLPEPEPEPPVTEEPAVEAADIGAAGELAEPAAVAELVEPAEPGAEVPRMSAEEVLGLFDDPVYRDLIRSAVRGRAERLLAEMVDQVITELEPLLRRHLSKQSHGAQ